MKVFTLKMFDFMIFFLRIFKLLEIEYTVKSQLETALKYKPPLNSNRSFDVTLKNELETALEL